MTDLQNQSPDPAVPSPLQIVLASFSSQFWFYSSDFTVLVESESCHQNASDNNSCHKPTVRYLSNTKQLVSILEYLGQGCLNLFPLKTKLKPNGRAQAESIYQLYCIVNMQMEGFH